MNKAILVIDMPDSCDKCPLFHGFYTDMTCSANNYSINYPYPKDFRQDWCPLKPVPEKYDMETAITRDFDYNGEFEYGYNQCIDEILRGDRKCTD
jgi:hypothetical protein